MAEVATVRGPVDVADLGTTLMHEHVFVLTTDVQRNFPEEWGREEARIAAAVDRLTELKRAGVDTIVDPTVLGIGRDIPASSGSTSRSTSTSWWRPACTPTATPRSSSASADRRSTRACPIRWWRCSCATSTRASPAPRFARRSSSARSTSRG